MMLVGLFLLAILWSALPYFLARAQCGYWHQDSWSSYRYYCLRSQNHSGAHRSASSRLRRGTVIWNPKT